MSQSLNDWRKSRLHELDLPSGLRVKLRDVDMTDLLMTGKLPASVLDMAQVAADTTSEVDLESIGLEVMQKNAGDFMALLNGIAQAALVEPGIAETPDDEHITLDELPMSDKTAIMEFVNRGAEQIRPFREGEDEPVAAVQPGDGLRETTE